MDTVTCVEMAVCIREYKQLAPASAYFLHVGFHFLEQAIVRRNHHDWHIAVNQRKWAMLELPRRVRFRMDI